MINLIDNLGYVALSVMTVCWLVVAIYEGEAGLSAILTVTLLAQLIFWAAVIAEWKGWI